MGEKDELFGSGGFEVGDMVLMVDLIIGAFWGLRYDGNAMAVGYLGDMSGKGNAVFFVHG